MNKEFEDVKDFHKAFGHPVAQTPTLLEKGRVDARWAWLFEEINEFAGAKTIHDQVDALIDTIYFALGTLVEIGVPPKKVFDIVQEANMNKLGDDGKPIYKDDGKVAKPEGWEAPEQKIKEYIDSII